MRTSMQQVARVSTPAALCHPEAGARPLRQHASGAPCKRARAPARRAAVIRAQGDGEAGHEARLGPNVISGVKELRDNVKWSPATIIRNDSASFDSNVRLIHLSIADHVDLLYGRKVQSVLDTKRWIDSYTVPGQFVGARFPSTTGSPGDGQVAERLYSIANSPYESRRDSAYIDASIIEIVADRAGSPDDKRIAEMGPGTQLEVSQVVGRGFSSLFNTSRNVLSAVESGKPLLLLAFGTRGLAPMRALLNWTPVQAHATRHKVACLYVTRSASTAAFLPGWDLWREAGVNFLPLYTEVYDPDATSNQQEVLGMLDSALFLREGGFASLAGQASDITILMSGASGDLSSQLTKRLFAKGVAHERILFCDFF